ncbi:hypothetical protein LTR53_003233 [Teratosphaeriaceae sp. CCFEE 6253]|nr:hypothetical protein LTR53_003233 [Teratosphaeriaceae sp. CCFEE 6253]
MDDPMAQYGVGEGALQKLTSPAAVKAARKDNSNYWSADPSTLLSSANVHERAESEVILVTCFWAQSSTSDDLGQSLRKLSTKAQHGNRTIRVRICFSSSSLWQKLSQTASLTGKNWPSSRWQSHLSLPPAHELPGLDLTVRSIFQLPFSVMHPKFVIVDRQRVLLPSCNVSWESWFEGCVDLNGPIVHQFLRFWQSFWAEKGDRHERSLADLPSDVEILTTQAPPTSGLLSCSGYTERNIPAMFLPSPNHRFSLPWLSSERPPPTPLNIYLLTLFTRAEQHIYMQTPNLTSEVVLTELLAALERGVDVTVVTSRKLMRLEQIVTAGTTTQRCVRWLIKQHKILLHRCSSASTTADVEAGLVSRTPGRLIIRFYEPRAAADRADDEPVQSHLKLLLVDAKIAVFGSGNMDRASWHTSQELGLALTSESLVKDVWQHLSIAMEGRSTTEYDSKKV